MPYFIELLNVSAVDAEPSYERLSEPHVSFGDAQQHAVTLSRPTEKDGGRTFRIVDENGQVILAQR